MFDVLRLSQKCVCLAFYDYAVGLLQSTIVTNFPGVNFVFPGVFCHFPGLSRSGFKFQDFPGFSRSVRTLFYQTLTKFSPCLVFLRNIIFWVGHRAYFFTIRQNVTRISRSGDISYSLTIVVWGALQIVEVDLH